MTEVMDQTDSEIPPGESAQVSLALPEDVPQTPQQGATEEARDDVLLEGFDERGGIVSARGTADGLALRLDGRVEKETLRGAIGNFMIARKGFLAGQGVSLEWVGRLPDDGFVKDITGFLESNYEVVVKMSRPLEREKFVRSALRPEVDDEAEPDISLRKSGALRMRAQSGEGERETGIRLERKPSLFDGVEALGREVHMAASRGLVGRGAIWDDPDCRMVYSTLRSGQKIESEHSVVVFGDVNSGAEIIAGGDIVVLGTLRGIAHAGAYDETGGGRVIFALNLQPTQLRIGSIISRGEADSGSEAEIARVEGTMIMVEPYASKGMGRRKK